VDSRCSYFPLIVGVNYDLILAVEVAQDRWCSIDDKRTEFARERLFITQQLPVGKAGVCFALVRTFLRDDKGPEFLFEFSIDPDGHMKANLVRE
jgi:hypothetical protein